MLGTVGKRLTREAADGGRHPDAIGRREGCCYRPTAGVPSENNPFPRHTPQTNPS